MKNRWSKGDPVNLSDLLKITPVANEIMRLSEELGMSIADVMWIASQIMENGDDFIPSERVGPAPVELSEEDWAELDRESLGDDLEPPMYMVSVKVNGTGRFPEIGFKAGVNDQEDMHYFFDMVIEMIDKLD